MRLYNMLTILIVLPAVPSPLDAPHLLQLLFHQLGLLRLLCLLCAELSLLSLLCLLLHLITILPLRRMRVWRLNVRQRRRLLPSQPGVCIPLLCLL